MKINILGALAAAQSAVQDEAGYCPALEMLTSSVSSCHSEEGPLDAACRLLLRTKSGSLADGINRYCVISSMLSCGVLLSIFMFVSQIQLEFNYQLFFHFSPPCSGPSVVILSCNRNHATGINWAVIAEALSTWTMLNCVHCAGTMTRNFFSPLILSVLHSNTSISLPFTPVCTNMWCRCPNFGRFYLFFLICRSE